MRIVLEDLLHVIPAAGSESDVADDGDQLRGPKANAKGVTELRA